MVSQMLDEIREQPDIIRRLMDTRFHEGLRDAIIERNIRFAYIAARGTSDNVAHYAKYVLEIQQGIPVALAAPSVFTIYDAIPHLDDKALVIGISQSGAGADVTAVVERARRTGALTASITNSADSLLASKAEFNLTTPAGEELSVAATKTYTSALAMIALLSTSLSADRPERLEELRLIPAAIDAILEMEDAIRLLAVRYAGVTDCVVIGRGYNHCTASEVALKLTETCLIGAKSFSAADFMHGPVALVHEGYPCLLIAPDGEALDSMVELAGKIRNSHPALITIAHNEALLDVSETALRIPAAIPEWLSPIVYVVAGQLFAHWLAKAKGYDPDHPRGLSKVTVTT